MSSVRETDLYQTLSIPQTASLRKARRLSRRIHRSEHGGLSDVADVAGQVLGDAALRARYDSLLGRLRAANMPIPTIGTLVVGALAMSAGDVDDAAGSSMSSHRIGANLKPDTSLIKLLVVVGISIAIIVFVTVS